MVEVIVDTETTGLDPEEGHRIVEIGMVEVEGYGRTGRTFQRYLNPERPMPQSAYEVHGLSDEFLADKPLFESVADELLEFIGDSRLVIHNAEFDQKFLNHELQKIGKPPLGDDRIFDTLRFARAELPRIGGYSLDALCRHFRIDRSAREKHGALLDAELLAEVYMMLTGGGQGLLDMLERPGDSDESASINRKRQTPRPEKLPSLLSESEAEAHAKMVKSLGEAALWNRIAVPKAQGPEKGTGGQAANT